MSEKKKILKASPSLPTTSELAMIAASLASAKGKGDYAKFAKQGLHLWHICADTIAHEKFIYEIAAERAPEDLKLYGKLDKKKYTLGELLRQGFKGRKTESNRMFAFREFLKVWLRVEKARAEGEDWSSLDEPSLDERNAALDTYRKQGFDKGTYCLMLRTIDIWKGLMRSEKASKGGKAKAAKSKAKKKAN